MNESDPLISVIICTRNRRELVVRAIDSVLAQESVRTEIIVVDDCSEDDTYESLKACYRNRIVLVGLELNRRVAYATNRGFNESTGEFIALLGDDDYWNDSKKLDKQLAVFAASDTNLGVVGTWWTEKHQSGEQLAREPMEPDNWKERMLESGGVICGSTPLIRREAWIAAGGLDERMPRGTDSDLFRGIILAGYEAKIIQQNTTIVDVGHGLTRMTTNRGLREARRTAYAHAYLLWKYRRHYIRHRKAMLTRMRSLVLTPLIAIIR